jgi:hypothetical protein
MVLEPEERTVCVSTRISQVLGQGAEELAYGSRRGGAAKPSPASGLGLLGR